MGCKLFLAEQLKEKQKPTHTHTQKMGHWKVLLLSINYNPQNVIKLG